MTNLKLCPTAIEIFLALPVTCFLFSKYFPFSIKEMPKHMTQPLEEKLPVTDSHLVITGTRGQRLLAYRCYKTIPYLATGCPRQQCKLLPMSLSWG